MKGFYVSWNTLETVFHEILWKKNFAVYPSLRRNIRVRWNKQIQKSRRVTVRDPIKKVTTWVTLFEIIREFTKSISSTRIGKPILMIDIKVCKYKYISRWVDWNNLIYVRLNSILNCPQRQRLWSIEEKKVRQQMK